MKKTILLLLLLLTVCVSVSASDYEGYLEKIIEDTDFSSLEEFTDEKYVDFDFKSTLKALASGQAAYNPKNILKAVMEFFFESITEALGLTARMLCVALLSTLILNLKNSFKTKGTDGAYFICLALVCTYGIKLFTDAASAASETIMEITAFMNSLIPILLTFAATSGKTATAMAVHPVMFTSTAVVTTIIGKFIIPMIYIFTAVKLTNSFATDMNLEKIANIISKVIKWTIGIVLTVFIGLMAVYSTVVPKVDAVTLKTAKFAVGSFIPVVGGLLSDSVDVVIACSEILKNAVGVTGVIFIIILCFYPAVKILVQSLIINIASSIISVLGDSCITKAVSSVAEAMTLIFSMILTVTVMLIIILAFVVGFV